MIRRNINKENVIEKNHVNNNDFNYSFCKSGEEVTGEISSLFGILIEM